VQLPIDADLKAFADGGFIALFDEDGVQSDGSAGRRGVNLTVLDPRTGEVLEKVGFDTAASAAESERLVEFVDGIAAGAPVLAVTYGDATAYLERGRAGGAEFPRCGAECRRMYAATISPSPASRARRRERRRR
jgi:hypothetical protein